MNSAERNYSIDYYFKLKEIKGVIEYDGEQAEEAVVFDWVQLNKIRAMDGTQSIMYEGNKLSSDGKTEQAYADFRLDWFHGMLSGVVNIAVKI